MKIIEIKSKSDLLKYLINSRYIGQGKNAVCFLKKDGRVIKIYYRNQLRDIKHFEMLSSVTNDTFIGPNELLINNEKCLGYMYPYIDAKTLKKAKYMYKVHELLDRYDKLLIDAKEISEKKLVLGDIHEKNILLGDNFYFIDLDCGYVKEDFDVAQIYYKNITEINKQIIYSLFNVEQDEILTFTDDSIQELYKCSIHNNENKFPDLLQEFTKRCYPNTDTNLTLRKKVQNTKTLNSYFRYF